MRRVSRNLLLGWFILFLLPPIPTIYATFIGSVIWMDGYDELGYRLPVLLFGFDAKFLFLVVDLWSDIGQRIDGREGRLFGDVGVLWSDGGDGRWTAQTASAKAY